jgi:UDP-N-acetylglucosamine diphosphorylase/glucosamine-1-phosphate N-acetyltransferase
MDILLDDIPYNNSLFPFGTVRSIAHNRIGIFTLFEKWNFYFPGRVTIASEKAVQGKEETSFVRFPANVIPSHLFLKELNQKNKEIPLTPDCKIIEHPWQLFENNDWAIRQDFEMLAQSKKPRPIPEDNRVICPENVFIEAGATINFSILNAQNGPIFIAKNAEVMEGCLLRGPISIGENSVVKMGTKIYGATTIGPYCLVGGEIKNSILMGFSNKAHDGYLGDSVIGEWCNLGAGTSNSNLKNNASIVKVWSKKNNDFTPAGKKCGLLMGDYSRSAINTSFNTGTVVGVCCNVFGKSFPPKFIDNFTWGNEKYQIEKAIADITNWKQLKGREMSSKEIQSLKKVYQ